MRNNRYLISVWLLIGPFLATLIVFFLFAFIRTIFYSFTEYDLFNTPQWVGLQNYINIVSDPLFVISLRNSFFFSIVVTTLQTVLALLLAVAVNGEVKGKGFFRTAYYIPSIMSSAAITLIFIWFYQERGFLNFFLTMLHNYQNVILLFVLVMGSAHVVLTVFYHIIGTKISRFDPLLLWIGAITAIVITMTFLSFDIVPLYDDDIRIAWIGSQDMFGPLPMSMWAIVIQNTFTTVPTLMLLFLAGLQNIPRDLYEAAEIDGANKWQQLIHITVPQLTPVTFVVVTMGLIGTLQLFDQVALLGDGVPIEAKTTLAYYVYNNAFPNGTVPQIGFASAASLVLGAVTVFLLWVQKKFGVKEHAK